MRQLGILKVLDRLIQQALHQVLQPVFDPDFSESSYGFHPGQSAHDAAYFGLSGTSLRFYPAFCNRSEATLFKNVKGAGWSPQSSSF